MRSENEGQISLQGKVLGCWQRARQKRDKGTNGEFGEWPKVGPRAEVVAPKGMMQDCQGQRGQRQPRQEHDSLLAHPQSPWWA